MDMSCLICVLFAVSLVGIHPLEGADISTGSQYLQFTVDPDVYTLGSENSVILNCTFSPSDDLQLASLVSIVISRMTDENNHQTLLEHVAVNAFSGTLTSNGLPNEIPSAQLNDIPDQSYLALTIDSPTADQMGEYECEVNALTEMGHPASFFGRATIRAEPVVQACTLDDLDRLHEELYNERLSHNLTAQKLEKAETTLRDLSIYLLNNFFEHSAPYNGSRYFLYKQQSPDADVAEDICEELGGYLAEIEDDDEMNFVINFVQNFTHAPVNPFPFSSIYLGARDDVMEGVWYYRHSNKTMTYNHWGPGEPNLGTTENCLVLYNSQWLGDNPCKPYPTFVTSFLCEVPIHAGMDNLYSPD